MKSRRRGCGTRDDNRLWLNTDCWYGAAPRLARSPIRSHLHPLPGAIYSNRSGLFTGSLTYMIIIFCVSTIYVKVFVPWFGATLLGLFARVTLITLAVLAALSHLRSERPPILVPAPPACPPPVFPSRFLQLCCRTLALFRATAAPSILRTGTVRATAATTSSRPARTTAASVVDASSRWGGAVVFCRAGALAALSAFTSSAAFAPLCY